jgi:hypothetical protein
MLFMGKLHQFFQHMALFSQNNVNTNRVKHGITSEGLDIKSTSIAVKLASKFWKKMMEHINDNTVPKEIPSFACTLFVEQADISFTTALAATKPAETSAAISSEAKGKRAGDEPRKKSRQASHSIKVSRWVFST